MKTLIVTTILLATGMAAAQIDSRVNAPGTPAAVPATPGNSPQAETQESGQQNRSSALSALDIIENDSGRDQLFITGQFSEYLDSTAQHTTGGDGFGAASEIAGRVQLNRVWQNSSLVLDYTGGFGQGGRDSGLTQDYQEIGVVQMFNHRRWYFLAGGHLTHLPESSFGFNAFRSIPDVNATLDPRITTPQSLFTQPTTQLNETFVAQADYALSHRSSISASINYGRLTFDNQDLLDSSQVSTSFGYNHILSVRDSVALSYIFSQFNFEEVAPRVQTHDIQFIYRRRLPHRMGLKVSVGPEIRNFQHTLPDPGLQTSITGSAELGWQVGRTELSVGYIRQTNAGSGVLVGSLMDLVSLNADRRFARVWHAIGSVGYAHTGSLEGFAALGRQSFNSGYASIRIERDITRSMTGFMSYSLQAQGAQGDVAGLTYPTRHLIIFGFVFRARPVMLR